MGQEKSLVELQNIQDLTIDFPIIPCYEDRQRKATRHRTKREAYLKL